MASQIVLEKGMPVIVRQGGFHTLKSFLGCVGWLYHGRIWTRRYYEISIPWDVTHIMDGESYYKALRAHVLIDSAFCCYLFKNVITEEDLVDMTCYIAKCSNDKLGINHKNRVVQNV